MKIAKDLTQLVGKTPLVKINKLNNSEATIVAKLEYYNPANSIKDRVAVNIIEDAEKKGLIKAGETTLIEATSGNTGIGLAFVSAIKGFKLILTMPESMSIERRKLIKAYGAEIILTEASKGMKGSIDKAEELSKTIKNSFMTKQFENPANFEIHQKTTAEEILKDTDNKVDIVVIGVGTGGTLTGVAMVLKKKLPNVKIVAVEPEKSPVLSGGKKGSHSIQGIGAGFIPKILDTNLIDEVFKVFDEDALKTSRNLAKKEGILVGVSSGASAYASLKIAKRPENKGKLIVFIAPSLGERELSTKLFEE